MLDTGCRMHREVTVVHLIDDNIRRIGHWGTPIPFPTGRIGLPPINYRAPIAIDTNRFGEYPGRLHLPLATDLNTERIKFTFKIALKGYVPQAVVSTTHGKGTIGHC